MSDEDFAPESVLVLMGSTATGKSTAGVAVAKRIDGEIISADSRAFFAGLEVVAAVPSETERAGIPHHLIGHVPIDRSYDAMAFRRDVERLIPDIRRRGRVPILVGGGTLYLGAILRGIFEGPSKDPRFRRGIRKRTTDALYEELARVDPSAAKAIHRNDRLRIERALEVHSLTGRPISEWQAEATPLPYAYVAFSLTRERSDHRAAIRERVLGMLDRGLVEEIRGLRRAGLTEEDQAYRTIGIPEVLAYLDGECSEVEMVEAIVGQTWALARRQRAWFRRDPDVKWLDVTGRSVEDVAGEIADGWRARVECASE